MGIKSRQLKIFCDTYDIDFPDFKIERQGPWFYTSVSWYGHCITTSEFELSDDASVSSALINLNAWLEIEKNFIWLINSSKDNKMIF